MSVEYKDWVLTPGEQERFDDWMGRVLVVHTGTIDIRNKKTNWTPLRKPLSECVVGLMTTGGVHLKSDSPFDIDSPHGDSTFREIPATVDTSELVISHSHYGHTDADRDINSMFPLDRLRELRDEGYIGELIPTAYSIMGFIPNPTQLVEETAPEIVRRFKAQGADLVFLTCG